VLPLSCQLGSGLCRLTLNSAAQVLGIEIGVLARRLRLVVGLSAHRLGLPPSGRDQSLALSLRLVDLRLDLVAQLGA
jgi:hypothetical protein